jgi:hypothetical protein
VKRRLPLRPGAPTAPHTSCLQSAWSAAHRPSGSWCCAPAPSAPGVFDQSMAMNTAGWLAAESTSRIAEARRSTKPDPQSRATNGSNKERSRVIEQLHGLSARTSSQQADHERAQPPPQLRARADQPNSRQSHGTESFENELLAFTPSATAGRERVRRQ